MGLVLGFALTVRAVTFMTDDGVVSIEAPDPEDEDTAVWKQTVDPNHWFTISDGKSTITIVHLSNGENLPQLQIADDDCETVFQTFASTTNEIFVLKASSPEEKNLDDLMQNAGTMRILKYETKTALTNRETAAESEYGIRNISAVYYVTADELNVRSFYSTDSEVLGVLRRGEEVKVTGAVQRNGADYGWYRIFWEGKDAYVSAGFLRQYEVTSSL